MQKELLEKINNIDLEEDLGGNFSTIDTDLEDKFDDIFKSANIIEGYEVVNNNRKNIIKYTREIHAYGKRQNKISKHIEDIYLTVRNIENLLNRLKDDLRVDPEAVAHLKSKILDMLSYESDFAKMQKQVQDIEKKKMDYLKLAQAENRNMVAAIKVQGEALKEENLLVAIHQELFSYDKAHKTEFHVNFLNGVKQRMIERMKGQDLSVKSLSIFQGKNPVRSQVDQNTKVNEIMEKYGVCNIVAETAFRIWVHVESKKPNKRWYMKMCVEKAIQICREKYPNISIEGKLIKKIKQEDINETHEQSNVA